MVAGHLQEKRGLFYVVLNYKDWEGKRRTKWIATGLEAKGNKKKAEAVLMEARRSFNPDEKPVDAEMLFADYLDRWLETTKHSVQLITHATYAGMVKTVIAPYFRAKAVTLKGLQPKDIQDFYASELRRVKASTVIHYHATINKALRYAVKTDLLEVSPMNKVERPKFDRFVGSYYDSEEILKLFEAAKDTRLELPVLFGAFYGLRRSEVVGLKWDAVDFVNDTFTIRHTVTAFNLDGKHIVNAADTTKTKSSLRTLPLVPVFREKLLALKEEQAENRRLCGKSYCVDYMDYICVNEIGELLKPDYVTGAFQKLLEKNGMRRIRFHDLRHSCASLLSAAGVPMKQIQEWLGHSDFSTTANIYAHLDFKSKVVSANALLDGLGQTGVMSAIGQA